MHSDKIQKVQELGQQVFKQPASFYASRVKAKEDSCACCYCYVVAVTDGSSIQFRTSTKSVDEATDDLINHLTKQLT